jgi:hypothetical protein
MIAVEARGRLGNQLFQFAFGVAAAARLGTDFAMNDDLLRPNFTLEPWGAPARRLSRSSRYRIAQRRSPFPVVRFDDAYQAPGEVLALVKDRTHYAGFFQSELFFKDAAADVRRMFRPRPEHERAFKDRYEDLLREPYVCCHVRRTDYLDWRGGVALPVSYYRAGLERLALDPGRTIVVVGDDLDWLRDELGDERFRFERNEEIVDLLLLANAQELVLSNSSFAWWGAWLNERASRVVAPQYWVGFNERRECPERVLARRWEQIPVVPSLTGASR